MLIFTAQTFHDKNQISFRVKGNLVHPKRLSGNIFFIIILCVLCCAQTPPNCVPQNDSILAVCICKKNFGPMYGSHMRATAIRKTSVHELTCSHFKRIDLRDFNKW